MSVRPGRLQQSTLSSPYTRYILVGPSDHYRDQGYVIEGEGYTRLLKHQDFKALDYIQTFIVRYRLYPMVGVVTRLPSLQPALPPLIDTPVF